MSIDLNPLLQVQLHMFQQKQAQRNTKEVWTATGTVVEGRHHVPISNLCIATNVKYEGGRGVGENILDKTTREDYRGGTGTPQGY